MYVVTRGERHRRAAEELGATWVGDENARPPVELDRAITFASPRPYADYDRLLWGERQLRSVANMTRQDARDLLALAAELGIRQQVSTFPLSDANRALAAVKQEGAAGSTVIVN